MLVFRGIEGARAWLAWTVVLAHVVTLTGLRHAVPQTEVFNLAANHAVNLFIIISGFVIANLVIDKHEPYPLYIARRLLRLYPVYAICLVLAILALPLGFEAIDALQWQHPGQLDHYADQAREIQEGRLPWHVLWHALLLHGAIPNNLLDESEYIFLAPAWSVSLEWQFYLLAPFLVHALIRPRHHLPILAFSALLFIAYQAGLLGHFYLPSFLPGSIGYFLVGIGTRLSIDRIGTLARYPTVLIAGCGMLALASAKLVPLFGWMALISYSLLDEKAFVKPDLVTRLLRGMLDSRLAQGAGLRSYSVYIVHWVLINVTLYLIVKSHVPFAPWQICAITLAGTVLLTLASSEFLYRHVERPGIALGRRLGGPRKPAPKEVRRVGASDVAGKPCRAT